MLRNGGVYGCFDFTVPTPQIPPSLAPFPTGEATGRTFTTLPGTAVVQWVFGWCLSFDVSRETRVVVVVEVLPCGVFGGGLLRVNRTGQPAAATRCRFFAVAVGSVAALGVESLRLSLMIRRRSFLKSPSSFFLELG